MITENIREIALSFLAIFHVEAVYDSVRHTDGRHYDSSGVDLGGDVEKNLRGRYDHIGTVTPQAVACLLYTSDAADE